MATTAQVASQDDETREIDVADDMVYEMPPAPTPASLATLEIDHREDPMTIFELRRKHSRQQLVLAPAYQRHDVWNVVKQSRFIESVLLNYPLPAVYLNQRVDGSYVVVDGRQRITAALNFLDGGYPLQGLTTLSWLDGKTFPQLEIAMQARIEDRKLTCYTLRPSVPMRAVYDIFFRINTGGVQLSRQEVRNGILQGPSTQLLQRLAESPEFRAATDASISGNRMRDREQALRCIAFRLAGVEAYQGDMDRFLNDTMKRINSHPGLVPAVEAEFLDTMARCSRMFGRACFRLPTYKTRGQVNAAAMEAVYGWAATVSDDAVSPNLAALQAAWGDLTKDPEFVDGVLRATGDKRRVQARFRRAAEVLGGALC